MECAFERVQKDFGDPRCGSHNKAGDACFPQASSVPRVGDKLTMDDFKKNGALRQAMLRPALQNSPTPNDIQQIHKLAVLTEMMRKTSAPYNMSDVTNYMMACMQAGAGGEGWP